MDVRDSVQWANGPCMKWGMRNPFLWLRKAANMW
ncbi:MAG: hypothetical protein UY32_C0013G0035 [Candidatus Jorgensenbacteria bacterium GW2011_GWC1_48_8]|uniref:Uncharacterized protein n=1 Tax=Candidatus Jorgensenbacteria bacterium GW2011_GWC1_48_8 TaxID=1618666 RepID=A0A0G1X8C3_9BACT|nr:MAG: hypothetical protein UY32_C0013G0035 [Candidatus Jorgensenbacteria bacterium GW2011_GWC1_48_8]